MHVELKRLLYWTQEINGIVSGVHCDFVSFGLASMDEINIADTQPTGVWTKWLKTNHPPSEKTKKLEIADFNSLDLGRPGDEAYDLFLTPGPRTMRYSF